MPSLSLTQLLIAFALLFILSLLLLSLALKISTFKRELGYINREIRRTTGSEQAHWKRQKRRLWKSLLLFVR